MRSEEGNREGRAGEHMNLKISIGSQDFAFLREHNCFLVDKTDFIKKWWESGDAVTLITRPRRFGKTLNMSMLNCFFSRQYEHRGDLFEGLNIWSDLKYRNIQGSYPVIYLSFADVKQDCYGDTVQKIRHIIGDKGNASPLHCTHRVIIAAPGQKKSGPDRATVNKSASVG